MASRTLRDCMWVVFKLNLRQSVTATTGKLHRLRPFLLLLAKQIVTRAFCVISSKVSSLRSITPSVMKLRRASQEQSWMGWGEGGVRWGAVFILQASTPSKDSSLKNTAHLWHFSLLEAKECWERHSHSKGKGWPFCVLAFAIGVETVGKSCFCMSDSLIIICIPLTCFVSDKVVYIVRIVS